MDGRLRYFGRAHDAPVYDNIVPVQNQWGR